MRHSTHHTARNAVTRNLLILALAVLTLSAGSVGASTFRSGESIDISNLHVIDDDLYVAASERVIMDGVVKGDFQALGYETRIKGQIHGSANVGAMYVDHAGQIDGSFRVGAQSLVIDGLVNGSLIAFAGENIAIERGARIERDVTVMSGQRVVLAGYTGGRLDCSAPEIVITGTVVGDLNLKSEKIVISPPANIQGDVYYESSKEEALEVDAGVNILGEVHWRRPDTLDTDSGPSLTDLIFEVAKLLAIFLFTIIAVSLFKPYAEVAVEEISDRTLMSFVVGLIGSVVLVVIVLILATALVTWVLGISLIQDDMPVFGALLVAVSTLTIPITLFASVCGAIMLYAGKALMGFWLGRLLLKLVKKETRTLSRLALLVGLIVLWLIFAIPYLGTLAYIVASLSGMGAVVMGIRNCRRATSLNSTS